VDPLDLLAAASGQALDTVLLARPADGFSLVGLGRAWEFSGGGPDRFAQAARAWQALMRDCVGEIPAVGVVEGGMPDGAPGGAPPGWLKAGPVLLGGFAFAHDAPADGVWEGFPASWLVLPRMAVACAGGSAWITLSVLVDPGQSARSHDGDVAEECLDVLAGVMAGRSHVNAQHRDQRSPSQRTEGITVEERPAAVTWKRKVASAADAVRKGALRKVVLARSVRVRGSAFDPVQILRRLRSDYPDCTVFAVARRGGCFVGATPERLVRVRNGEVRAMALAGSAPRGRTDDEDRLLGESLLASAKDCIEHSLVVEQLREALDGPCESVAVTASPSLLRMPNVQHLCTPVRARLRNHSTVVDLAGRLHPTPAVGGVPRNDALEWIRRREGLDRGWYAGPVGWMDRAGRGEFSVAIRSALLRGGEAVLYAGCGIVADSDPDQEYEESCLKLRPMLSALGVDQDGGA
jgi:salicylate biosynthesis isochorismate synthase/menaquinone-specific isochorismate synthase